MDQSETRESLLEKRKELLERIERVKADFRQGLDKDWEEQAVQLENAEVLDGIAKAAEEELQRINEKLAAMGE